MSKTDRIRASKLIGFHLLEKAMACEKRIKELLRSLIEIPSPTGEEGPFQNYLKGLLEGLGFECFLQEVLPSRPNLIAWRGRTPLLLCTHSDTIPAQSYELMEDGPYLKGRGVLDAKGQISALVAAVERTNAPAALAFTVDEEEGGAGGEGLWIPPWVSMAIVLEPTGLRIAVAQMGAIELEVEIAGKEAHGSCPDMGENAVDKAIELINSLKSLPFLGKAHELLGPSEVVPLWIEGGDRDLYIVPGSARLRVDIRIIPPLNPEPLLDGIIGVIEGFGSAKIIDSKPPFETRPESEIVSLLRNACKEVLGEGQPLVGMPSWTDADPLHRKGLEVVLFGAGDLHLAHTSSEMVKVRDLSLLSDTLKRCIEMAASSTLRM
jgi:acetylornithine deacetylase